MTTPYTGGCACGAVRYAVAADPMAELHCQCHHCQQRSGTGHSSYLAFSTRVGTTITGEPSEWRIKGDSGNEKIHAFCPTCGTPVFVTFAAAPDMIALHTGSLDDPGRFRPTLVTYAIRGLGWDRIDPALQAFDTMPG